MNVLISRFDIIQQQLDKAVHLTAFRVCNDHLLKYFGYYFPALLLNIHEHSHALVNPSLLLNTQAQVVDLLGHEDLNKISSVSAHLMQGLIQKLRHP